MKSAHIHLGNALLIRGLLKQAPREAIRLAHEPYSTHPGAEIETR
ncbi:hypothetical protein [Verticiella sediminum]|nr:hypothetical protein [Verticiella sediminum]